MQSLFHGVREYLTPVLTESAFEDKGILTPEEFVAAGDLLVYKCPTWRWESGDAALRRPHLPADKQFLVTRNVPCRRRVTALELNYQSERAVEGEDEWVAAQSYGNNGDSSKPHDGLDLDDAEDALGHISLDDKGSPPPAPASGLNILDAIVDNYGDVDGPPDLSSFEEDNLVEDDAAALSGPASGYLVASEPGIGLGDDEDDAILYTRTYDLSITYDKYYQTPRVWLFGYDEKSVPLSQDALFEDIMQDYANRTVTMEPHPHKQGLLHASIHPCQHAAVMKRILANLRGDDEQTQQQSQQIRSDQYLFLFLKFIQSVVPTIDYDHTIEVNAKK